MLAYRTRSFLLVSSLSALVATVGCGGNVVVDRGGEPSGAGGAGGGTGEGSGASQSNGSSSQPPSQYGTPTVACTVKTGKFFVCAQDFGGATADKLLASCHAEKGQVVDHCPAAGTIGCCAVHEPQFGLVEECAYGSGITSKQFEQACSSAKGTFTITP
jgi:hypothetical protein